MLDTMTTAVSLGVVMVVLSDKVYSRIWDIRLYVIVGGCSGGGDIGYHDYCSVAGRSHGCCVR